jgi:hypothetical protein
MDPAYSGDAGRAGATALVLAPENDPIEGVMASSYGVPAGSEIEVVSTGSGPMPVRSIDAAADAGAEATEPVAVPEMSGAMVMGCVASAFGVGAVDDAA